MRGLAKQVALVSGGTGLIGSAIVQRLVEENVHVVVASRDRAKAEAWIKKSRTRDNAQT